MTLSYSILASSSSATVAKIIIYESGKGKTNGNWPDLQEGVYALLRANDEIGDRIWRELLPPRLPAELEHTTRERTIGVAPPHSEMVRICSRDRSQSRTRRKIPHHLRI